MIVCFAALLAVVMVSRLFGRAAGIFAAATCGASVAYVMPPAFSFEVDSFLDQIVLAAYGAISLLVLYRIPARFTRYVASAPTRTQPGVELSALVHRMLPTGIRRGSDHRSAGPRGRGRAARCAESRPRATQHRKPVGLWGPRTRCGPHLDRGPLPRPACRSLRSDLSPPRRHILRQRLRARLSDLAHPIIFFRTAYSTISAVLCRFSFCIMLVRWLSTVCGLNCKAAATSLFEFPSASNCKTSFSRSVSSS